VAEDFFAPFSDRLRDSAPYRALRTRLGAVTRLPPAAAAWVIDLLARDLGRSALVVLPHESDVGGWLDGARLMASEAIHLAASGLTPYHATEVSVGERAQVITAMARLIEGGDRVIVTTPRGLFRRLPRPEALRGRIIQIRVGDELPPESFSERLIEAGYTRADLVSDVGEFATRGGVIDVFPPDEDEPVRIDLFGDTIESLRRFDPTDQRSKTRQERAAILPMSLFPVGRDAALRLAEKLQTSASGRGSLALEERLVALRERESFAGWERWLPWVSQSTSGLPEWARDPLTVVLEPMAVGREVEHHAALLEREREALVEEGVPAPPPEALEQAASTVSAWLRSAEVTLVGAGEDESAIDFGALPTDSFHRQLPRFPRELETARERQERLVVVAPAGHRSGVEEYCRNADLSLGPGGVEIVAGELSRGYRLPVAGLVLYSERQLFARPSVAAAGRRSVLSSFLPTMRDLKVGDYVVHRDHGIGQLVELQVVESERRGAGPVPERLADLRPDSGGEMEALRIRYADGKSLLVPLERIDLIQKYSGIESIKPRLDRLGGTSWNARKARVRKSMRKLAGDLLKLYAERRLATAPTMPGGTDLQAQFAAAFEFQETPDQLDATRAIRSDLESTTPMDRLLCGDVGFGKTEVAMRAAMQVVEAGYQVVVLAPTTILADQHLETFRERFEGFPVNIDMISRFRSVAEVREISGRVEAKEVDILIGTHRLLSRDIRVPQLGLLIVDEEQRFGVAQKERFRELKKNVHVLAMSATPVPRTLQMSLAGVRDLSVIETPPRDRRAVETVVVPISSDLVREAIGFELDRGGQIYYVHNRVEDIDQVAAWIRELAPEVRVTVGHGQMDESELARRMHAFKRGEYDLLLATTIIENGIHIPRVNTMLIHHAERFGLAQLYQLRGRVGRGHQLGYCYLLVADVRALTEEARHRLEAIREFTELGSGFRVAARDLEIRGAGNLLGAEQSGHIAAVGIETYMRMLDETVRELRGEVVEEGPSVALDLPVEAKIPPQYVSSPQLRMELYQRIAASEDEASIQAELRDRFGPLPEATQRLIHLASLKRLAERMRVQSISASGRTLNLRLRTDARVDVDRLIQTVSETPGVSFSPDGVLALEDQEPAAMIESARGILERIEAAGREVAGEPA